MPLGTEDLVSEIRGMREDFRKVSEQLGALTSEVKHLARSQEQTVGYGERIRSLETEVVALKQEIRDEEAARQSSERSAATERRWVIGMLVPCAFAILGLIFAVWRGH